MSGIQSLDYYTRLRSWYELKQKLENTNLSTLLYEVDRFWQQVHIVRYYLHPADVVDWPNPWELIRDNTFCKYARGLGIIYTLMFLDIKDIDFIDAIDDNDENVCLVLVDNAKYILNSDSGHLVNMKLSDFKNLKYLDITSLDKKIGK